MRRPLFLPAFALLALGACHADVNLTDDGNSSDGSSHIAIRDDAAGGKSGGNKVSVNVPGFSANLSLPSMDLGGHVELDGIKMAPDTKVGSIDVTAQDKADGDDSGKVRLSFTNPRAPAAVIDHYARSATDAGFTDVVRTATAVTAQKGGKSFALNVAPQGAGSQGTIAMAGKD